MIEVKDIVMQFGSVIAVNRVNFEVKKGEILGLLGPNGAGKTTLMRMLTTFLVPTSGTAAIGGHDIVTNPLEVRKMLGYLPETAPLYMEMRVDEYLRFIAQARGLAGISATSRVAWVIEKTHLKQVLKHSIAHLSKGYRQRVGLAQALLHDPEVLILDEPTSGLDPLQIVDIRGLVTELAESANKTIILSTHIMQEASAISNRIVIMHEGMKIADGSIDELEKQAMKKDRSRLVVKAPCKEVQEALSGIRVATKIELVKESPDGFVTFEIHNKFGDDLWQEVNELVKTKEWPLRSFARHRLSLEETFLEITRSASKKATSTKEAA